MRKSNIALRLQESLLTKKLATLRTEDYFRERGERGSVARAKRILKKAGKGNAPVRGDEVE